MPHSVRRWVLWLLAGLVAGAPALRAEANRPPDVLSLRHRILEPERYAELAGAWEAYVQAHPRDAAAHVEWGDALRYAGNHAAGVERYAQAYEIDSTSAPALAAHLSNAIHRSWDDPARLGRYHRQLVRASLRTPEYADLYYTLFLTSLMTGDEQRAADCLRRVVDLGDMIAPLLDYAHNMLAGAAPNAIVFTNGDNDTYPLLARQALFGERPDVAVVNLSLLNTQWYIRRLREHGLPITLDDRAIAALEPGAQNPISGQVQRHLFENLAREKQPRPLYYSVTVAAERRTLPGRLETEGLLQRLVPAAGGEIGVAQTAIARSRELFDSVYRLDSLTDPLVDWEREAAVARMGMNYVPVLCDVGLSLEGRSAPATPAGAARPAEGCPESDGGRYLYRAVGIASFHGHEPLARGILEDWARQDPGDPLLAAARALIDRK